MPLFDLECCGVREYFGTNNDGATAADVIAEIAHRTEPRREHGGTCAFILFNDVAKNRRVRRFYDDFWDEWVAEDDGEELYETTGLGVEIKAYIRKHKLGTVVSTRPAENPNTQNKVQVHVWCVDWKAFHKFAEKDTTCVERAKREREQRARWRFE